MGPEGTYLAAATAMAGLVLIPLFVLSILSCCTVIRHRGDPARSGLPWLIATFPFAILGILFLVLSGIITLVLLAQQDLRSSQRTITPSQIMSLRMASLRISTVSVFFLRIAEILVVIVFVELCNGFLYALNGQNSAMRKGFRFASYGVAVLLFALALAWLGLYNAAYTRYLEQDGDYLALTRALRITSQISGAYDIVQWIISGLLIALTAVVVHKYRRIPAARSATILLLVAAIISFIRWLYSLIFDALYILPETRSLVFIPIYIQVIDAIFNIWLFFIILVLLYALGAKKAGGLWSTAQPWTAGAPVHMVPAPQPGYQYGPPQQGPYQPAYQYGAPPPQMMQQQPYVPPQAAVYQPATQPHAGHQA